MGRHGAHGEDARRNRGKREPEPAPESDTSASTPREPIGRRLRPEESAITEPPTGFLGSGWSATTELSEPVWPEEERRPGGRLKTALLAVAAVAVVAGGTVVGIQVMSGPASSVTDCPVAGCLAAASNQPEPYIALSEPAEPPPTRKAESEGETDLPSAPAPVTTPQHTGRTSHARPSPTPTGTHAPRRSPSARPSGESRPTPTMTEEAVISETRTRPPSPTTAPPVTDPSADPSTQATEPSVVSGGATVTLGFGVVKEKSSAYTAQLVVAAGEALDGVTLSLPVGGEVTSVRGAGWRQTGDTLVIESARNLEAGEKLVVTFSVYGRAQTPRTCQSAQGDCAVV